MDKTEKLISLTPGLPTYSEARAFLKVIQGERYTHYRNMYNQIWDQVGTPQENEDWSDPDTWIPLRLTGESQALADKIWKDTHHTVNPRYVRGCWYLGKKHNLLVTGPDDLLSLTAEGKTFLEKVGGELEAGIDSREGLLNILKTVSEHSPGRRADILPGYAEFCNTFTNYHKEGVHKSSLVDRLLNLIERGFIQRNGTLYEITAKGSAYLEKHGAKLLGAVISSHQTEIYKLAQQITKDARGNLKNYLSSMDPYKFEHLIKVLLQEMGYENVEVTAPSHDKGVDVVADIQLGISSVREVVQVKRHIASIRREIVDQLRGSLHYFKALRGTIITSGKFSNGAKEASLAPNVAPITLIDGEKLLDLLIEYQIGIAAKTVEYHEFDESKLLHLDEESLPPGEPEE